MNKLLKSPFFWLIGLTIFYLVTRLINLTALPIFTDEAIYIRWAQIGGRDASWRFISLTDGKQPLFIWIMMVSIRLFQDPLFAGRLVSVASGFLGMIGMYVLGYEIFRSRRTALIASFLYVISPFALFYDRLALYDSLVTTCALLNFYLSIRFVKHIQLDSALLLGIGLGIGMLNKTSGFLILYLLPWTLILFDWKGKLLFNRLSKWLGFSFIVVLLSQVIYSILRLSPYFYIIAQKDTIFVYPFSLWITHPFEFFYGNIHGMINWLFGYMTWPLVFLALVSLLFFFKNLREKLILAGWWFFPFIALSLFGRVLYPRYILFMVMPLYLLASWSMNYLMRKIQNIWISFVLLFMIIFPSIFISYSILFSIKSAQIPKSEMGQYISDWPSGWGINEITNFIKEQSKKGKVSVYTEGTFGLLPYAFEIYLVDRAEIDIHGIWPVPAIMPEEIALKAKDHPTYFVMYQSQEKPASWPLSLISSYDKGLNKKSTMRLYKVNPQE